MFKELSLRNMRSRLVKYGVSMSDEQFQALTYKELKKIYKMSGKAYALYEQVDTIICKKKAQTPEIPMKKSLDNSPKM